MKITILDRDTVTNGDISLAEIEALGEVVYRSADDFATLDEAIADSDAVIVNKQHIGGDTMEKCPKLKFIGVFATGYNNIDTVSAKRLGITVCNVPGYSTDCVAQLTFSFILQLAGHLCEYSESVRDGEWVRSKWFTYFPFGISEISGKTLGIFGYGAIGKKVARIADAFGMKVIVCTRTFPKDCPYEVVDKESLFRRSDFLSLHCPLTDATRNTVNAETLALMKPTACLINTCRGAVTDEKAVADALNSGVIAGAGIDVLTDEPMRSDNPFLTAKNCYVTPHIGWAGLETRVRLITAVADNLRCFAAGMPINVVNK